MRALILFPMILAMLAACERGPVGNPNVPEPAKAVVLERYLGKWYEIGRYENRFEKGCEDVTAEYRALPEGRIGVTNRCYKPAEGVHDVAEGVARVVEGARNAKLEVSFFGPFYGDYWVLDRAADYSWSIVGEPSGRYLWLLARSPNLSSTQKEALWKRAAALGYDTSLIRPVSHGNAAEVTPKR